MRFRRDFGRAPQSAPVPRRASVAADEPLVFKICSLLLQYPGEEQETQHALILDAVDGLAPSGAQQAIVDFCSWWAATPTLERRQHYVEVLDLHKRAGLYLTFYGDGDKRERGSSLLRLKQLYRSAGLPLDGSELPDFLPVMLEFASAAPDGRGVLVLREHRAALELLRLSLRDLGTPYASLVDAVCETVGDASPMDRLRAGELARGGPPQELVGLEPFAPPEVMPTAGARR